MCDRPVLCGEDPVFPEVQLPTEIWEIILKKLQAPDLLKAASVCSQWRHLARGLCRERCQRLPPRLLSELHHEYLTSCLPAVSHSTTTSLSASPSPLPAEDITEDPALALGQHESSPNDVLRIEKEISPLSDRFNEGAADEEERIDWLALTAMLHQTDLTAEPQCCFVTHQLENVTHLAAAGSFVVVVSWNSDRSSCVIHVVDGSGEDDHCWQHHIAGRVHKVCAIETPDNPPILAVCVDRELQCYLLRPHLQTLAPLSVLPTITVDSRLCCDGSTLVVSDLVGLQQLALYDAVPFLQEGKIELILKGRIQTSSPPIYWDLWNGFVTAVVSGGYVSSYTLTGSLVAESPLYKDLRYPNPTILTRGLVFASTITSRTLLSYWHMDRDRDYWLLGESVLASWVKRGQKAVGNTSIVRKGHPGSGSQSPALELPPAAILPERPESHIQAFPETSSICILTLAKIRVGKVLALETTAIHYKRGLVFCGTSQGHLLVYQLLMRNKTRGTLVDWTVLENHSPILTLSVSSRPVSRVVSYFHEQFVVVAVGDRNGNCFVISIPNTEYTSHA
ncbi:uncharacterized protein LOC122248968 [Penaeus japonicus]|uniref:uncharacterized protein LOC122248968 n=1 Tax=Penaeus japonicus TaxID=27405 RepID=UPI001C70F816|nr:uncharacterized protein LOC122248968 [Penaeus japonicus]